MTSNDLHSALRNTYPAPNFMYLKEARDATGFDCHRTADAIAIGMYRSCGQLIHGFELKVSRTDWLKELSNAAKAESLMRYCHRWSLIVPDTTIVKDGELPPTWGLGVWSQTRKNALPKIKWIVRPPELLPLPMSMVFFTAMIYAATKIDADTHEKQMKMEYERGRQNAKDAIDREHGREAHRKLTAAVDAFEKSAGIHISEYISEDTANRTGLLFKEWRRSLETVERSRKNLEILQKQAEQCHRAITNVLTMGDEKLTWEQRQGIS